MPWGEAAGQNIEHPHTLAILSSFFLLQMHFSFIGKAQFRRATLFCDSSYCLNEIYYLKKNALGPFWMVYVFSALTPCHLYHAFVIGTGKSILLSA